MDWYRWFPSLYSEATLHLNLEQDAIYRRLIDWYMQNRMPLPSHSTALARICQISIDKWSEHSETVLPFFRLTGTRYHHKRCDIELDRQDSTSKKLSDAAKKASEARARNKAESITSEPSQSQAAAMVPIDKKRREVEDKENTVCANAQPQLLLFKGEKEGVPALIPIALSPDFELDDEWGAHAEQVSGFDPADIIRQSRDFRFYFTKGAGSGKARTIEQWFQSWDYWMKTAKEKRDGKIQREKQKRSRGSGASDYQRH